MPVGPVPQVGPLGVASRLGSLGLAHMCVGQTPEGKYPPWGV
jgi:hypothetical protein